MVIIPMQKLFNTSDLELVPDFGISFLLQILKGLHNDLSLNYRIDFKCCILKDNFGGEYFMSSPHNKATFIYIILEDIITAHNWSTVIH